MSFFRFQVTINIAGFPLLNPLPRSPPINETPLLETRYAYPHARIQPECTHWQSVDEAGRIANPSYVFRSLGG
jgi:hypothetical protein